MAESLIAQPSKANTLAETGLPPEVQQAGATLAAAVTLGGGPVLKLLQKGGVAKLGKLAPDLVGALRSMTPAQAEALTGALNDVGVDLSINVGVEEISKRLGSRIKDR
jgi:hypothetical protein